MTTSFIPLSPEQRAQRWGTILRWGGFIGAGYLVAPIIMATIHGMLGLIAALGIAGAAWAAMPALHTFGANLRLRMLKAAAAADPISTLENEHLRREQALAERAIKINALAAKTENFGSQLADFQRRFPQNAEKYARVYEKMKALVTESRKEWKKGQAALNDFSGQIEQAKAEWAMAQSASDLQKDAGKVEEEFLARIRTSAAFETVQLGMSTAIATIDDLLMETPMELPSENRERIFVNPPATAAKTQTQQNS